MTGRRLWIAWALSGSLCAPPAFSDDHKAVVVTPAEAWQVRIFEALRARGRGRGGGLGELFTAQTRFVNEQGENSVLVCWEETKDQGPDGLDIIVDSEVVAHVDGLPSIWLPECQCRLVTGLGEDGPIPGGDFDGDGTPEEEELLHSFEVVGPQGHLGVQLQKVRDDKFFGEAQEVTCGFIGASCADDEEECEIELGGNGGAPPPSSYDFYVDGNVRLQVPGDDWAFSDDLSCYAFAVNTRGPHRIQVVSTVSRHDSIWNRSGVYLGNLLETSCATQCGEPRNYFVPGAFDGASDGPSIGSVIFALNGFFGGGEPLPCLAAADSNGDGSIDLSDLVYVLLYLFSGGQHPFGWRDQNLDGIADVTCRGAPVEDCLESHASCQ